jgi:hypothetical protein
LVGCPTKTSNRLCAIGWSCFSPNLNLRLRSRKKIEMQKVLACMNTVCPKGEGVIEPAQLMRLNFEDVPMPLLWRGIQASETRLTWAE